VPPEQAPAGPVGPGVGVTPAVGARPAGAWGVRVTRPGVAGGTWGGCGARCRVRVGTGVGPGGGRSGGRISMYMGDGVALLLQACAARERVMAAARMDGRRQTSGNSRASSVIGAERGLARSRERLCSDFAGRQAGTARCR